MYSYRCDANSCNCFEIYDYMKRSFIRISYYCTNKLRELREILGKSSFSFFFLFGKKYISERHIYNIH